MGHPSSKRRRRNEQLTGRNADCKFPRRLSPRGPAFPRGVGAGDRPRGPLSRASEVTPRKTWMGRPERVTMSGVPAQSAHLISLRNRESSINSLKELIIILTGLAITSALGVLLKSATEASQHFDTLNFDLLITPTRLQTIILLILLLPCVLRFYHGNIMILDRYYLMEPGRTENVRNITLDFIAILAMSLILVAMGFSITAPILYFFAFIVILLISIIWNSINIVVLSNVFNIDSGVSEVASIDKKKIRELRSQLIWLANNTFFLILFIPIFFIDASLINTIHISLKQIHFYELALIIFINSSIDIWSSRKDYFPKFVA